MRKITKKQFLSDVMHEIEMLKEHATLVEKERLDFEQFDPADIECCIYGQLTGSCESNRAKELMDLSCIRVLTEQWRFNIEYKPISTILNYVNGNYNGQDWLLDGGRNIEYLSALEGYIYSENAKNDEIISYIKGETETLTL